MSGGFRQSKFFLFDRAAPVVEDVLQDAELKIIVCLRHVGRVAREEGYSETASKIDEIVREMSTSRSEADLIAALKEHEDVVLEIVRSGGRLT